MIQCVLLHPVQADDETANDGFTAIYNGKNLDGWDCLNGDLKAWTADGELLSCTGHDGGWLRSKKAYTDFVLRLEYRIPEGGNSGVGIRFPKKGNPAFDGIEIQILDDDHEKYKDLVPSQYTGGLYYQAAAKRGAINKPGEWNKYEITCKGRQVKVVLNDQVINDVDLDYYKEGKGGHSALADRPEIGYVGFQSHGSRVDFRNVHLKDLTTKTKSGLAYTDIKIGEGEVVKPGAYVTVHYTGRLANGKTFDSSRTKGQPFPTSLNNVVDGWKEGIPGMRVGGRRKLVIPGHLGYGEGGYPGLIPPNATLVFDVEVISVR